MSHGTATPLPPPSQDATEARIAALSREYLDADDARKQQIGATIAAIIDGDVIPMERKEAD